MASAVPPALVTPSSAVFAFGSATHKHTIFRARHHHHPRESPSIALHAKLSITTTAPNDTIGLACAKAERAASSSPLR